MLTLVLTWIGIALATTMLLLMALGPVIVELDDWFATRGRRRARTQAKAAARQTTRPTVVTRTATPV
jgi:hypothetical protein